MTICNLQSVKRGPSEASAETNFIFDWTGSWTDSVPIVVTTFVGNFMWNASQAA